MANGKYAEIFQLVLKADKDKGVTINIPSISLQHLKTGLSKLKAAHNKEQLELCAYLGDDPELIKDTFQYKIIANGRDVDPELARRLGISEMESTVRITLSTKPSFEFTLVKGV